MVFVKFKSFKVWVQEYVLICEEYILYIDIICEDCEKFICFKCVKKDYRDYDWNIIVIVVIFIRRDLIN